jgi:hypothetical protein
MISPGPAKGPDPIVTCRGAPMCGRASPSYNTRMLPCRFDALEERPNRPLPTGCQDAGAVLAHIANHWGITHVYVIAQINQP